MNRTVTNWVSVALLFLFLVFSLLYINPRPRQMRSEYRSSELEKATSQYGNTVRTDYLDAGGRITIAADLGYATRTVTNSDNTELEEYFDDMGEPVSRYSGYFATLREYDDSGNNIKITYLDHEGEPFVISGGYAMEDRTFNSKNQMVSVKYLDAEGNPVLTRSYGCGKLNEYNDDGKVWRITYVDENDNPIMTGQGYAILTRLFYPADGPEKGRVESEYYFDAEANPVALSMGQYGVHKEYNEIGQESVLTYLGADGNPIKTSKGYATVKRTFHANGSLATEQYMDLEGNPIALSEGQFGISRKNGKTVYLNVDGSEQLNIKNLFYNESRLVILFAILLILVSFVVNRRWNIILFILYIGAIGYLTLLYRESGGSQAIMELFWSYKVIITDDTARSDILRNIWLFIPLGAILYRLYPKKLILLVPVALSALIEAVQYFTGTGLCELDDVISNGLGGAIGYMTGDLLSSLKAKRSVCRL